jgi:hypothetical protein
MRILVVGAGAIGGIGRRAEKRTWHCAAARFHCLGRYSERHVGARIARMGRAPVSSEYYHPDRRNSPIARERIARIPSPELCRRRRARDGNILDNLPVTPSSIRITCASTSCIRPRRYRTSHKLAHFSGLLGNCFPRWDYSRETT